MSPVAFYHHEACSLHDTGWRHPEHQGRLRAVMGAYSRRRERLHRRVEPRQGTPARAEDLEKIHRRAYLDRVREASRVAAADGEIRSLDADTRVSGSSWEAALAAAGTAADAAAAVASGEVPAAFCAVRPPGHHATPGEAMGFCLVNHVAHAARRLVDRELAGRVLVVDWDVHHGNGTQEIFYRDPDVYYLSLHQSPFYPGTGAASERGEGPGEGTTRNLPMGPGLEPERYTDALLEAVDEVAAEFRPQIVLVSCGFDAAASDPLGGFTLRPEDFRRLTREVRELTRDSAGGRLASCLEGGYDTETLGELAMTHLEALIDDGGDA